MLMGDFMMKKFLRHKNYIFCLTVVLILIFMVIFLFYRHKQFMYWITQNTGSVADWVGSVSVPIGIAWFTHQYTLQKDRQAREKREQQKEERERKDREQSKKIVLKVLLDLLTLLQNELPVNCNQLNYRQTFKFVLRNNLNLINTVRNEVYTYKDNDSSELLFQELKKLISIVKDNKDMTFDQIKFANNTLKSSLDALQKKYDSLDKIK